MYIYTLQEMLEMIAEMPPEELGNSEKCLRFLEISKKEVQTEDEKKFIEDYTYVVSEDHWEHTEWMIRKGLRN